MSQNLFSSAESGDLTSVTTLVRAGGAVDTTGPGSWSLVSIASYNGHMDVVQFLLSEGANPNLKSTYGWSALHYAVVNRHPEICKLLLQHGADRDAQTNSGATALHYGCMNGSAACVKLLLQSGANHLLRDGTGKLPLDVVKHAELSTVEREEIVSLLSQVALAGTPLRQLCVERLARLPPTAVAALAQPPVAVPTHLAAEIRSVRAALARAEEEEEPEAEPELAEAELELAVPELRRTEGLDRLDLTERPCKRPRHTSEGETSVQSAQSAAPLCSSSQSATPLCSSAHVDVHVLRPSALQPDSRDAEPETLRRIILEQQTRISEMQEQLSRLEEAHQRDTQNLQRQLVQLQRQALQMQQAHNRQARHLQQQVEELTEALGSAEAK